MNKLISIILLTSSIAHAIGINGKIKHISYLNDYNVMEVENFINNRETIFIKFNKNNEKYKKGQKVKGVCNNKKNRYNEYYECPFIDIMK